MMPYLQIKNKCSEVNWTQDAYGPIVTERWILWSTNMGEKACQRYFNELTKWDLNLLKFCQLPNYKRVYLGQIIVSNIILTN